MFGKFSCEMAKKHDDKINQTPWIKDLEQDTKNFFYNFHDQMLQFKEWNRRATSFLKHYAAAQIRLNEESQLVEQVCENPNVDILQKLTTLSTANTEQPQTRGFLPPDFDTMTDDQFLKALNNSSFNLDETQHQSVVVDPNYGNFGNATNNFPN